MTDATQAEIAALIMMQGGGSPVSDNSIIHQIDMLPTYRTLKLTDDWSIQFKHGNTDLDATSVSINRNNNDEIMLEAKYHSLFTCAYKKAVLKFFYANLGAVIDYYKTTQYYYNGAYRNMEFTFSRFEDENPAATFRPMGSSLMLSGTRRNYGHMKVWDASGVYVDEDNAQYGGASYSITFGSNVYGNANFNTAKEFLDACYEWSQSQ